MSDVQLLALGDVTLAVEVHGAGPLVVAAHGFPDAPGTFRHQIPALVAAGFQVACPAMRGYAPSSPSRSGRYDAGALGADLVAIGDALSPAAPFGLLGHDWGAVASQAAAALAPGRVAALATMAVPHLRVAWSRFLRPRQLARSRYMLEFQPRAADDTVRAHDFARVEALWRRWSPGYRATTEELRAVKDALAPHLDGPLGYYRAIPRTPPSTVRLLFTRTRAPGLYLHGADDGCIGVEVARGVERAYLRGCEVAVVEAAGHFVHLERPEVVNPRLVGFFGRHLATTAR